MENSICIFAANVDYRALEGGKHFKDCFEPQFGSLKESAVAVSESCYLADYDAAHPVLEAVCGYCHRHNIPFLVAELRAVSHGGNLAAGAGSVSKDRAAREGFAA